VNVGRNRRESGDWRSSRRWGPPYPAKVAGNATRQTQPEKASHALSEDLVPGIAGPQVPDEVISVLAILPSASILADPTGRVVRASTRSVALGLISHGEIAIHEITALVERVGSDGLPREQEMRIRRMPLGREVLELRVRVAALRRDVIVVLIDDLADERRVDAVRRDFVANVSHELKTPVGALSLLAEAIQSSSDDPEQVRSFAARMQMEATRLSSLIQDVIDLSRLQSDDPLTRGEVVEIDSLVLRAVDDVRILATAHDVAFILGEPSASLVFGDRGQLQTALRNLLVNAISYSPSDTKVAVDVRQSGQIVEIIVKDQGIGIPSHDIDRVFERFYRVDQARSRTTGGTGLGLAIVKHVCQNHGGECTVWSEVGVGSTFTMRLPAYAGQSTADLAQVSALAISQQEVLP